MKKIKTKEDPLNFVRFWRHGEEHAGKVYKKTKKFIVVWDGFNYIKISIKKPKPITWFSSCPHKLRMINYTIEKTRITLVSICDCCKKKFSTTKHLTEKEAGLDV